MPGEGNAGIAEGSNSMKKIALSMIAAILMLTLLAGTALATGDMTIRRAKTYSDPGLTKRVGSIPKYTAVTLNGTGTYGNIKYADITVDGVQYYVKAGTLTLGAYEKKYTGTATMLKGAWFYHGRHSSKYTVIKKDTKVYVYAIHKGKALVRTSNGNYGFTSTVNLINMKKK